MHTCVVRATLQRISPVRMILLGFALAAWLGTLALMLPVARRGPGGATFMEALFTATSAICVTGLITVDTPSHWTPFGQTVIMVLIQVGGFGVMTLASIIGYTILHKLSLRARMTAAAEARDGGIKEVHQVVLGVLRISLAVESAATLLLAGRFWLGYGHNPLEALWLGLFHSVSSFNNAGFALFSDSMVSYATDPWICLPIMASIIVGGLGFPVVAQLLRYFGRPLRWSMNTRLVLFMTALLLVGGTFFFTALEWGNPGTLGPYEWHEKLLVGAFQSVQTRTAGFNSIDVGAVHPATLLWMDVLMFIGGGPAGTAGGIKVTTFAVLFFIIWTEIRGEGAVNIFGKRLSRAVHRQAIAVALVAVALVLGATMLLLLLNPYPLAQVQFEVISAFATVGLSTGITAGLEPVSLVVLCALMFLGRVGPVTFAYALALRSRRRLYELPKERPIIG